MTASPFYTLEQALAEVRNLLAIARKGNYPRIDVCASLIRMYLEDQGKEPEDCGTSYFELVLFEDVGQATARNPEPQTRPATKTGQSYLPQMLLFRMINACRVGRCDELAQQILASLAARGQTIESLVYRNAKTGKNNRMDSVVFDRVVRAGWLSEARTSLKRAKTVALTGDALEHVTYLRLCLSEAGAKPADIKSSEQEIVAVLRQGSMVCASNWWRYAMKAPSKQRFDEDVAIMREVLRRGRILLAAIGLKEADITARRSRFVNGTNGVHAD